MSKGGAGVGVIVDVGAGVAVGRGVGVGPGVSTGALCVVSLPAVTSPAVTHAGWFEMQHTIHQSLLAVRPITISSWPFRASPTTSYPVPGPRRPVTLAPL